MTILRRVRDDHLLGVRFAVNVFIATTVLWILIQDVGKLHPIWAIASMIAASEPVVTNAMKMFRSRIINSLVGCAIGLFFLIVGGSVWKLPIALAVAVLISVYVVRIQVMWRQAPITAAIVIASGLEHQSRATGIQDGLLKVTEVLIGCVVGLLTSWMMSKLWPVAAAPAKDSPAKS